MMELNTLCDDGDWFWTTVRRSRCRAVEAPVMSWYRNDVDDTPTKAIASIVRRAAWALSDFSKHPHQTTWIVTWETLRCCTAVAADHGDGRGVEADAVRWAMSNEDQRRSCALMISQTSWNLCVAQVKPAVEFQLGAMVLRAMRI
jgi:hypothetical protein